jgi:hypothetical protein
MQPSGCFSRQIKKYPTMKNLVTSFLFLVSLNFAFAQNLDFHLDKEYAIAKNGIIDLRSSDAKVFINGTERTATAHIKIDREVTTKGWYSSKGEFKVSVEAENGNISIRENQNQVQVGIIGYYKEEYKIEIEVPTGVSLQIKGDDGDYWIKNIAGNISLDLDDADVELKNCNGNKFTFDLDDGDLKMSGGKGSIEIDADDSDLTFENANFTSINANVDDGKLIIQNSITENGNYVLRSQDGLIVFDILSGGGLFSIRHDDGNIMAEGDFRKIQETEHFTELSLGNAAAKVNIKADDASVKLRALNK